MDRKLSLQHSRILFSSLFKSALAMRLFCLFKQFVILSRLISFFFPMRFRIAHIDISKEKFEGWWVYLVDRRTRQLITKPVYVATLQTEEEVSFNFLTQQLCLHGCPELLVCRWYVQVASQLYAITVRE